MKTRFLLGVLAMLAVPVVANTAYAGESDEITTCSRTQGDDLVLECERHCQELMAAAKEATGLCGNGRAGEDQVERRAFRSAMMDGRPGGWPRRHDHRRLGAKRTATTGVRPSTSGAGDCT